MITTAAATNLETSRPCVRLPLQRAQMRSLESSPEWAPVYLAARLSGGSPLEIASMLGMKVGLGVRAGCVC